ncbi:MAG TPA: amino acid permease, partial [Thermodesulfobacteriota bacterium]|nr:amino acid permease [Thermodesulfobacteriota bacterium]
MGLFSATVLVVANMVGTGIFTTSGFIMQELADPGALLLCWVVGGVFALSGALCYGELGVRFPLAGGEYVYLRESYGRIMAFLSGWISLLVGFSAPIAAASMACAAYLSSVAPEHVRLSMNTPLFPAGWIRVSPVAIIACSIIAFFSLV